MHKYTVGYIYAFMCVCTHTHTHIYIYMSGAICGVMLTNLGNGHSDQSSNPGQGCFHFTSH